MKQKAIEIFGWYGTAAIILAYALVSFSYVRAGSLWYQLLNATGALGVMLSSFSKKDYQPGVLNILWTIIAIIAMCKSIF